VGRLSDISRITKQQSGRAEKEIWHPESYLSPVSVLSFADAFRSVVNVVVMHLEVNDK